MPSDPNAEPPRSAAHLARRGCFEPGEGSIPSLRPGEGDDHETSDVREARRAASRALREEIAGNEWTERDRIAVEFAAVTSLSIAAVASSVGMTPERLTILLEDPRAKEVVKAARERQSLRAAEMAQRVFALTDKAANALEEALAPGVPWHARLRAAQVVVDKQVPTVTATRVDQRTTYVVDEDTREAVLSALRSNALNGAGPVIDAKPEKPADG